MDEKFNITLDREITIDDKILIAGFPGVGLTGSIAANFIIDSLKMEKIGYFLSDKLPPAAVVQEGIPSHPVRLYSKDHIMIMLSDFAIPVQLSSIISNTLLNWKDKGQQFKLILTLEGIITEQPSQENKEIRVFGVGSTEPARKMLKEGNIELLDHGWITGASGLLLGEGNRLNIDVICLLADANPMYPDARSAAKLVETVDTLLPKIELDLKPLYEEAEKIKANITAKLQKAKDMIAARQPAADRMTKGYMYG